MVKTFDFERLFALSKNIVIKILRKDIFRRLFAGAVVRPVILTVT